MIPIYNYAYLEIDLDKGTDLRSMFLINKQKKTGFKFFRNGNEKKKEDIEVADEVMNFIVIKDKQESRKRDQ